MTRRKNHPHDSEHESAYKKGSLTLTGSIAMGTGVMIGAGIFALPGHFGGSLVYGWEYVLS